MMTIEELENRLSDKSKITEIRKAYLYALEEHKNIKRLTGDDFITHPLEVANILIDLNADNDAIIAALLHETINNGNSTFEMLRDNFGEEIAKIVDSITKINKLELSDDNEASALYLRKILVGMSGDVRVIYIKLADRLHNMRTNWAINPNKQKAKAKETMDILVPIAHRLGMNSVKSELENLCLEYLKPDVYKDILDRLAASKKELDSDINAMKKGIGGILKDNDINYEIKGRVKSVYSIYQKLTTGRKWDDIYDILALRVFVNNESDCYTVVGLIHSKYRPIPKRFKDYIASPKSNMYQSLHTSVIGENGKLYEVQIRTYEMDEIAEKGIASHVSYKEKNKGKVQSLMEQKLEMFRNIIEANNESSDVDFKAAVNTDFLNEVMYVYTPKGDVVELPKGATPIDFAYRIHSSVGDKATGAIVNNSIVSFDHELEDGDVVKINTSTTGKPNKAWLNIVKTSQARNKIKAYFSKATKVSYIQKGKEILEKELRRKKLSFDEVISSNLNKILSDLKLSNIEDLYLAVGSLRYTAGYIINLSVADKKDVSDALINKEFRKNNERNSYKSDIIVDGETNILVSLAKCCSPVKGDDIIGYITMGQGITVHTKSCVNVNLDDKRIIDVTWNNDASSEYLCRIYIKCENDCNILPSLIEVCQKRDIKISSFNTSNSKEDTVYELIINVRENSEIDDLLNQLNMIKAVISVGKKVGEL